MPLSPRLRGDDGVDAAVATQACRDAAALRVGKRQAERIESLAVLPAEMVPSAEPEHAREAGIGLAVIVAVLQLGEQERRVLEAEVHAVSVAFLRVSGARPCGVAVIKRDENRDLVVRLYLQADAGR